MSHSTLIQAARNSTFQMLYREIEDQNAIAILCLVGIDSMLYINVMESMW